MIVVCQRIYKSISPAFIVGLANLAAPQAIMIKA
jgi:hypothetical protein